MAGYIGKSQGVTQVDGYNRTEADDRYVNASGDTMTGGLTVNGLIIGQSNDSYFGNYSSGAYGDIGNLGTSEVWLDARSSTLADVPINLRTKGSGAFKFIVGSSEAMNIDGAGRVTMPYQPAFFARSSSKSGDTFVSYTSVPNTPLVNVGGHLNTTTGVFTCPISGIYLITAVGNDTANSTTRKIGYIRVNGLSLDEAFEATDQYADTGTSYILSLSANDAVTLATHTSFPWGGCKFGGYLIG